MSEAWSTLTEDLRTLNFGARHGAAILGLVYALRAGAEVFEHLQKAHEAMDHVDGQDGEPGE